jgi:hypothetical protein
LKKKKKGARDIPPDNDVNGFRCDFETLNARGFVQLAIIFTWGQRCPKGDT